MKFFYGIITTLFIAPSIFASGASNFNEGMEPILKQYLVIHQNLMDGKMSDIASSADTIIAQAKKLDPASVKGHQANHYKDVPKNLIASATKLKSAKSVDDAREIFKKLSQPMAMWAGMAKPDGYTVKFCSMTKGSWVQKGTKTMNPYYGQGHKMASCGQTI